MARKKVDVGNGYTLCFTQRARGQESPYYVGVVWKDGREVGEFRNGGTGGMTLVTPDSVRKDFATMAQSAADRLGLGAVFEPEGVVVTFGELKGYARGCACLTLDEVVKEMAAACSEQSAEASS